MVIRQLPDDLHPWVETLDNRMQPERVVIPHPAIGEELTLTGRVERLRVGELIPVAAVERIGQAVLPRSPWQHPLACRRLPTQIALRSGCTSSMEIQALFCATIGRCNNFGSRGAPTWLGMHGLVAPERPVGVRCPLLHRRTCRGPSDVRRFPACG